MSEGKNVPSSKPTDLDAGLYAIRRAYRDAKAGLHTMPDLGMAYAIATRLADVIREIADDAALTRAEMAAQVRDAEELSLAGLAARLGVSKARAGQLLKAARKE